MARPQSDKMASCMCLISSKFEVKSLLFFFKFQKSYLHGTFFNVILLIFIQCGLVQSMVFVYIITFAVLSSWHHIKPNNMKMIFELGLLAYLNNYILETIWMLQNLLGSTICSSLIKSLQFFFLMNMAA